MFSSNFSNDQSETSTSNFTCNKNPDLFCFMCSEFISSKSSYKITDNIKAQYDRTFKNDSVSSSFVANGGDSLHVPSKLCPKCVRDLKLASDGQKQSRFETPAIWQSPIESLSSHEDYCFVCATQLSRSAKNKFKVEVIYAQNSNLQKPVLISCENAPKKAKWQSSSESSESEIEITENLSIRSSQLYTQDKLNDLVRRLDLSKDQATQLASDLKSNNLLDADCRIEYYSKRNEELIPFFNEDNTGDIYLENIEGLFGWLDFGIRVQDCKMFIDSSQSSFKIGLLHDSNKLSSIPLLYSRNSNKTYRGLVHALDLVNYSRYNWKVVADLKLLNSIFGEGTISLKYPCILCHRKQNSQSNLRRREISEHLIKLENVMLSPLDIKIGLVRQFFSKLDPEDMAFEYISNLLPHKSEEQLLAGKLNCSEIRKLFDNSQNIAQILSFDRRNSFLSLESVCANFLSENRSKDYKQIVEKMINDFYQMGCSMSLELHILANHLDEVSSNCSDFLDQMREHFNQDILDMEVRHQCQINKFIISDYCWFLKRNRSI